MKKAIAYIRVSKARDGMITQDTQLEKIKQYCKLQDIELIDTYIDLDYSGRSSNRPAFQKLFQNIKRDNLDADYLMVYKLDRFARSVTDFHNYMKVLDRHEVNFVSITQQFDTSTPIGRLIRNILVDFAQFESEMTSERVKDNLLRNAANGQWNGGTTPYGYRLTDEGLEINEKEAEIIKQFYSWYLEPGGSLNQIAQRVNKAKIKSSNGKTWAPSRIGEVLANPLYCIADQEVIAYFEKQDIEVFNQEAVDGKKALLRYNRRKSRNEVGALRDKSKWLIAVAEHNGIVSSDLYIKTQRKRDRRANRPSRAGTGVKGLLAYLLKCSDCGKAMTYYSSTKTLADGSKKNYSYYKCRGRNMGEMVCKGQSTKAEYAENLVIARLKELCKKDNLSKEIGNLKNELQESITLLENKAEEINAKLKKVNAEEKNLISKLKKLSSEHLITIIEEEAEELATKRNKLELELQSIDSQILEHSNELYSEEFLRSQLDLFEDNFDTMNFEDQRNLLQSIIKKINYDQGKVDIEYYF
jgi:site-specific DNA recombinase